LCVPEVPGLEVSPLDVFAHGIARAGYLQVPARADLALDFLATEWRTVQHYGVEIGGLRSDSPAMNPYRNRTSPYGGRHAGRWPFRAPPGIVHLPGQPGRRELFNHNETPSSRCSSSRDPYTGVTSHARPRAGNRGDARTAPARGANSA
jgi:hypothetical protein